MTRPTRRPPLPEEIAHKIYDILVEHVPISEKVDEALGMDHWRYSFVQYATEGDWVEYRIGGPLGFGGKVWFNADHWYVTCYREDETPERIEAINRTNAALDKLWEEHWGVPPRKW